MGPNEQILIFWRAVGNWGFLLVIVGVVGEVIVGVVEHWREENFERHKSGWKLFEAFAGALVVIGLAMEYKGHQNETGILDADNAQSYLESKQAETNAAASYLQAADARKESESARLTAANVESNNLSLKIELERLKYGRRINDADKIRKFIFLTERIKKGPVTIWAPIEGGDTLTFAHDFRKMLGDSGFQTNADAGEFGINVTHGASVWKYFENTNDIPDIYILSYGLNTNGVDILREPTNGMWRPITFDTNQSTIATSLIEPLKEIGITADWESQTNVLKPGEFIFYIPVK